MSKLSTDNAGIFVRDWMDLSDMSRIPVVRVPAHAYSGLTCVVVKCWTCDLKPFGWLYWGLTPL